MPDYPLEVDAKPGPRPITKVIPEFDPQDDISLDYAREFRPKIFGCRLYRDDLRHGRWIMDYPSPDQKVFTKAFSLELPPLAALKLLLAEVWAIHSVIQECPFDISKLPDIVGSLP